MDATLLPSPGGENSQRPRRRAVLLVLALLSTAGCDTVEYFEKGRFTDPLMLLDADHTETHFLQKRSYAREGSVGGLGPAAGGGCGCY